MTDHQSKAPQAIDAEQAVLGSILKDPEVLDDTVHILPDDSHFYVPKHRAIYAAALKLYGAGEPTDITTIANELSAGEQLSRVGGRVYLVELVEGVASTAHIIRHAEIVREKHQLRSLISTSTEIIRSAYRQESSASILLDQAESAIMRIGDGGQSLTLAERAGVRIPDVMEQIQRWQSGDEWKTTMRTGFESVDKMLHGLQAPRLIVIGGRPSHGKSQLAFQIAGDVAIHQRKGVLIVSLEMGRDEVIERLLFSEANVNSNKSKMGTMTDGEWDRVTAASNRLNDAPVYIWDPPSATPLQIRAVARRAKARHNIGLVIVDYLQLMTTDQGDTREQQVAHCSRSMKSLGKELHIPTIVLSQLSRQSEHGGERRPKLSDLRESGAIEQDADQVVFVYRAPKGECYVIVAKYRNGQIGSIEMAFLDGRWAEKTWRPEPEEPTHYGATEELPF